MQGELPIDDYVLYADDDEDDRMILSESFQKYAVDKTLITVNTGEELLQYLHNNIQTKGLPCLVIVDQNMPGLPGDVVIEMLRTNETLKHIPLVVFSTSQAMDATLLSKYKVPLEIKPNSFQLWEKIAIKLLEHCKQFKKENSN